MKSFKKRKLDTGAPFLFRKGCTVISFLNVFIYKYETVLAKAAISQQNSFSHQKLAVRKIRGNLSNGFIKKKVSLQYLLFHMGVVPRYIILKFS